MVPKLLIRHAGNPILKPTTVWWEEKGVFNPGAAVYKNKIILLYRAWGADGISRLGLAESEDGVTFKRFQLPVFEGGLANQFERLGVEDPRITQIGATYYIVYTATSLYPTTISSPLGNWAHSLNKPRVPYRVRVALTTTMDFQKFTHHDLLLPNSDSKDSALFPEKIKDYYFLLHRQLPDIWLTSSRDLRHFQDGKIIMNPKENWEKIKIGAAGPPLKTDLGWLLFYHGVDQNHVYRLGAVLLDHDNPTQILHRTREPLFAPERKYEKEGNIPNVVFSCGVVEKEESYHFYYGAADTVVGLARVPKKKLLSYLVGC